MANELNTDQGIFAIDDNPMNLALLSAVFKAHGCRFASAANAPEALAAMPAFRPAVILMDLQLPVVDGLTLTRQLRQDPAYAGVIIIAVTSYAMKGDRERALAAGCDDYVTKPIDTRGLPAMVANHLARHPAR
jgi:two-component system cell cycle response regulator DivK